MEMKKINPFAKELEQFLSTPLVRSKLSEAQEIVGIETLSRTCAWCKKLVAEDETVFALKGRSKIDLSNLEGLFFPLTLLSGKVLIGLVPSKNSDAWTEGADFLLVACCKECLKQMNNALEADIQTAEYMDEASKQ